MSNLAYRFLEAREMAGMTQAEVAEIVGLERTSITNMEAGRQVPSLQIFIDLCDTYDVSADWLLWGE